MRSGVPLEHTSDSMLCRKGHFGDQPMGPRKALTLLLLEELTAKTQMGLKL